MSDEMMKQIDYLLLPIFLPDRFLSKCTREELADLARYQARASGYFIVEENPHEQQDKVKKLVECASSEEFESYLRALVRNESSQASSQLSGEEKLKRLIKEQAFRLKFQIIKEFILMMDNLIKAKVDCSSIIRIKNNVKFCEKLLIEFASERENEPEEAGLKRELSQRDVDEDDEDERSSKKRDRENEQKENDDQENGEKRFKANDDKKEDNYEDTNVEEEDCLLVIDEESSENNQECYQTSDLSATEKSSNENEIKTEKVNHDNDVVLLKDIVASASDNNNNNDKESDTNEVIDKKHCDDSDEDEIEESRILDKSRFRKLRRKFKHLPILDDESQKKADSWICEAEMLAIRNSISRSNMLPFVLHRLKGNLLEIAKQFAHKPHGWYRFKSRLVEIFSANPSFKYLARLANIKLESFHSFESFMSGFKSLACRASYLDENMKTYYFLKALPDVVKFKIIEENSCWSFEEVVNWASISLNQLNRNNI